MAYRDHLITTMDQLQSLYGERMGASVVKEIDHINEGYRKLIEAAPFVAVATAGPEGLDCSPKGDAPGFVRILDDKTLAVPDRPGNRRADTFTNILQNPKVGLIFLVPGKTETLRVSGTAKIVRDSDLRESMSAHGKTPDFALVVETEEAFFHCSKCVMRSNLWKPAEWPALEGLPSLAQTMVDVATSLG